MKSPFKKGLSNGIPIALGYFSVSFGFGIMAVQSGLTAFQAIIISLTNLTSAGQAAGVGIIAAGGTLIEMALTQLVINLRYSLMGLSLSQKLSDKFTTPHRMLASFGITDEIFAVASSQKEKIVPSYMYGLILISFLGWTGGTAAGALAGLGLPQTLTAAMGILLYGMFIAIIIPDTKTEKGVLLAVILSSTLSCMFYFVPWFSWIPQGFSIIICAVVVSAILAYFFPKKIEEEEV